MSVLPLSTKPSASNASEAGSAKIAGSDAADFIALLTDSSRQLGGAEFSLNNSGSELVSLIQKNRNPDKYQRDDASSKEPDASVTVVRIKKTESVQSLQKILQQEEPKSSKENPDYSASRTDVISAANKPQESNNTPIKNTQEPDTASEVQAEDAIESQKKLRAAIQDELSRIEQILTSIVQLFSAAKTTTGITTGTISATGSFGDALSPSSTGTFSFSAISKQISGPQGSVNLVAFKATATGYSSAGDIPLLQNLQSIIDQLPQLFQGFAGADQAGSASPTSIVSASQTFSLSFFSASQSVFQGDFLQGTNNGAQATASGVLQDALTKLTELLSASQTNDSDLAKLLSASSKSPVAADNAQPENVLSLIKSTIADVRQQLKSLKDQNEAIFSQIQNAAAASGLNPDQIFKDTLSVNGLTVKETADQAAISYAYEGVPQAIEAPDAQVASNTQSELLFATGVTLVQQASEGFTNTDSGGNGQGQPSAQPVILTTTGQNQASTSSSAANFSRLLQQQAAPQAVLEQVSFQVKTALHDGSSKITIHLNPVELGKVDINVSVDSDGKTSVVVTADNRSTLDLLQRDAQGLSKALADAGLKTDSGSLSFNLGGGGQNQNNGSGNNTQSVTTYQKMQPEDDQDTNLAIITRSYVMNVTEGLDIEI